MNPKDPVSAQSPFFVGIGGIGISAIARMFLHEGKRVRGVDITSSEVTEELSRAGAEIQIASSGQQSAALIPADCDVIIYTIAIEHADPKFFSALKALSMPMYSYPEMLEQISRNKFTIAISGTHGKTTTTAMIGKILSDAGKDPTVIVGSLLQGSHSNFIAGKSSYLVVEACEYRRSFLQIHPTIAVITNIDDDHLDYYRDIGDITNAFSEFVSRVPKDGSIVTDTSLPHVREAISVVQGALIDISGMHERIPLSVPGAHNQHNARLALAVAAAIGIPRDRACKSLAEFSGAWRRFERRGVMKNGAEVVDDYAHHPTEIAATISGAREAFPNKKLTVVFQPHLFSRTKEHLDAFAESLAAADRIVLADIYPAREPFDASVSSRDIQERIVKKNPNVHFMPKFAEIVELLSERSGADDVILTMGAGETNKIADALVS